MYDVFNDFIFWNRSAHRFTRNKYQYITLEKSEVMNYCHWKINSTTLFLGFQLLVGKKKKKKIRRIQFEI